MQRQGERPHHGQIGSTHGLCGESRIGVDRFEALGVWLEPLVAFVLQGDANEDSCSTRPGNGRIWLEERPDDAKSVMAEVQALLAGSLDVLHVEAYPIPRHALAWAQEQLRELPDADLWTAAVVWAQAFTMGTMAARLRLERVRRLVHYLSGIRLPKESEMEVVRREVVRIVTERKARYLDIGEAVCPADGRAHAHAARDAARRLSWMGGCPVGDQLYGEALVGIERRASARRHDPADPLVSHGPVRDHAQYVATSLWVGLRFLQNTEEEPWQGPAMIRPRDATLVELLGLDAVLVDRLVFFERREVAGTLETWTRKLERSDVHDLWGPAKEALRVLWALRMTGGRLHAPAEARRRRFGARGGGEPSGAEGERIDLTRLAVAVGVRSIESLERFVPLFGPGGALERAEIVETARRGDAVLVRLSPGAFRALTKDRLPLDLVPASVARVIDPKALDERDRGPTPDDEDDLDDEDMTVGQWCALKRKQLPASVRVHEAVPERPLVLPEAMAHQLDRVLEMVPLRREALEDLGYGKLLGYGVGTVLMFEGPPGTGKTLGAHVVAQRMGRPLVEVGAAALLGSFVGSTERAIAEVFALARREQAVLLLDEADSLLQARAGAVRSWEVSQTNTLLRCLEQHDGVVVLTTNLVETLDPAVARRITLRLTFPRPGPRERAAIWRALTDERIVLPAARSPEKLAEAHEMTGSAIKSAVLDLAVCAVRRPDRTVTTDEVDAAVASALRAAALDEGSRAPVGFAPG